MSDIVHVAVAVIENVNHEVCITLRHVNTHQGGLWEFPGGKVEQGEAVEQALLRETREELGLEIKQFRPLINVTHTYKDGGQHKTVRLHVYRVLSYNGQASGREGQELEWVKASSLPDYDFPQANLAIVRAVQLPDKYLITGKFSGTDDFINKLKNALDHNIRLVQLRIKDDSMKDFSELQSMVEQTSALCQQTGAKLMLNISRRCLKHVDLSAIEFAGYHADSRTLMTLSRPPASQWFSASCHNRQEISRALQLGADFIVLSPVQKTASHPEMRAMGWQQFSSMIEELPVPVYALGGVSEKDMETAWLHGAQGVAAISAFWK